MSIQKNGFSPWVKWKDREELSGSGLLAPGVYAVAKTNNDLSGQRFTCLEEIIYFGVSRSLRTRLQQFDNTISGKRLEHGGADRVRHEYSKYDELVPNLYVAIQAVGTTEAKTSSAKTLSDSYRRIGNARRDEYHRLAEYHDLHGRLPEFNRPDTLKFSRAGTKLV